MCIRDRCQALCDASGVRGKNDGCVEMKRAHIAPARPSSSLMTITAPFFLSCFVLRAYFDWRVRRYRWKTKRDTEATVVLKRFLLDVKRYVRPPA